jgi:hypothetical protein
MPETFVKKPIEVQAIQWTGDNADELEVFARYNFIIPDEGHIDCAEIYDRLHGTWIKVSVGDWVIRGVHGEFYPCNSDVFEVTYEKVCEE